MHTRFPPFLVRLTLVLDTAFLPGSLKSPALLHDIRRQSGRAQQRYSEGQTEHSRANSSQERTQALIPHRNPTRPRTFLSQKKWARGQICEDAKYSQIETKGFHGSSSPELGLAAPCSALPQAKTDQAQYAPYRNQGSLCFQWQFSTSKPGIPLGSLDSATHCPRDFESHSSLSSQLPGHRENCPEEPTLEAGPTSLRTWWLVLGPTSGHRPTGHVQKDICM